MLLIDPFQMTSQEIIVENTMNFVQDLSDVGSESSSSTGAAAGNGMGLMLPLIIIAFLFVMMFGGRGRDKEGEKFRNALQKEQDVVTSSGIFGKIKDIDEVSVTLEIAQGMKIKVDKRYVNPVPTPQPAKPAKPSRRKKDPSKDEKA